MAAALADCDLDVARAVAEIAGFDWRPPQPACDDTSQGEPQQEPDQDESDRTEPPPDEFSARPFEEMPFWLLFRYAPLGEDTEPVPPTPSRPYRRWDLRPPNPPLIPPLSSWRELEPRLRRLLCLPQQGQAVDMELTVRHISRGHFLAVLPRERRRRWGPALRVIEDRSRRLTPFRLDQHLVVEALHGLLPDHDLSRAVFRDGMRSPRWMPAAGNTAGPGEGPIPPPGTIVLVLGDLGCLSGARTDLCEHWLRFGVDLRAAGCNPVALIPGPVERCPGRLARAWHLIPWERPRPRDLADSLEARAELLLRLVSPAVRIEPGLLRAARFLLKPSEADAGTEADVWQHPDLIGRSAAGATLNPERAKQLRAEFATRIDADLQARFAGLLRAWRGYLPKEIWFEELLNLPPHARAASEAAQDLPYARDYFADFARLGEGGPDSASASDLEWFERVERRAVPLLWQDEQVGDDLKRLNYTLRGQNPDYRPPPGFDPALIHRPDLPVRRLGLRQRGGMLELAPVEAGSEVVEPGSPLGQLTTRNGLVQVEEAFWETGQPPPWADAWGWDDFGAWVEFAVEGKDGQRVIQRMRWIEPGSFSMGSPADEPERLDREGPQHRVTIAQGFWLFDTACTQALWQAVMGKNPSRFQGTDRPVENVSCDDAQRFIAALNERLPGLDLGLPSEAQWEYACRAGTDTPFSFGANITPEQVNYHGEYPYAGGEKGLYRGETVPVASLPANAWGLYQMHGNVWEWVQDPWHDNYDGAPPDGSVWESSEAGAVRVVRGGSWDGFARRCRSAFRSRYGPDDRNSILGFRCARVHDRESGKQEAERARPVLPGPRSGSGRAAAGSSREARGLLEGFFLGSRALTDDEELSDKAVVIANIRKGLRVLGYDTIRGDRYRRKFRSAVLAFQRDYRHEYQDGYFGPGTRRLLAQVLVEKYGEKILSILGIGRAKAQQGVLQHVETHVGLRPGPQTQLLRLDNKAEAGAPFPSGRAFLIVTDRERLTLHRTEKPDWADAIGRDGFGLWTDIAVESERGEPVIQRLRWIPPGRFLMGSPEEETRGLAKEDYEREWFEREHPQHPVFITKGYWLFDTPCTQALWEAVMGKNPSRFKDPDRPVESVSWEDVQTRFLPALNERIPGFVLPSEAQWEHACRAGTETALYTGAIEIRGDMDAPALDPIAWYGGNSGVEYDLDEGEDTTQGWWEGKQKQYDHKRAGTRKVKAKQPNPWGLYDMLGNVFEWCQDSWYDYGADSIVDPVLHDEAGAGRVVRGGSWYGDAGYCRSAYRFRHEPDLRHYNLGFRCARVQNREPGEPGEQEEGAERADLSQSGPQSGKGRAATGTSRAAATGNRSKLSK